jgi:hypothetical protein
MACFQGSSLEIQGLLAAEFARNECYTSAAVEFQYQCPIIPLLYAAIPEDHGIKWRDYGAFGPLASPGHNLGVEHRCETLLSPRAKGYLVSRVRTVCRYW